MTLRLTDEHLGTIRAITDAYLGHLGVDDVLREITRRLCELLEVDTAVVLLREGDSSYLVARAAYGLEEEVRQGVRVPLGEGFAGSVAAKAIPMILDRVDESTVVNPLLWEHGLQAMIGVPLFDGRSVIGVLHVGSTTPRTFTDEEARSLQFAADRVADAVRSRGREAERVTAQVLQRSLLPSTLPHCPGVAFATRYVPAEEGGIGGDWYDAFRTPPGDLWVMVGDVAGHGLLPAVIMGRARAALRSYALEGHGPERVLDLTHRKLRFFEPGSMVTVLLAVSSPPYDRICFASAGHMPPVLASPCERAEIVAVPANLPLGVPFEQPIASVTVDFPPGSVMLAYTDGLIERRDESLDDGLERLAAAVRAREPEAVCREVMEALIGHDVPRDDVAVIAVRGDTE